MRLLQRIRAERTNVGRWGGKIKNRKAHSSNSSVRASRLSIKENQTLVQLAIAGEVIQGKPTHALFKTSADWMRHYCLGFFFPVWSIVFLAFNFFKSISCLSLFSIWTTEVKFLYCLGQQFWTSVTDLLSNKTERKQNSYSGSRNAKLTARATICMYLQPTEQASTPTSKLCWCS